MTRRPIRPEQRAKRGQVMVLFGLFSLLLFAVVGLAVDAGMSYLSSDRAERAAAAAALAGVAYLPGDYPGAQNAALVEAARNGFSNAGAGNACAGNPSPCVVTSQPVGTTNQLTVTISVNVQTTFLRVVGFGNHTVQRFATAEYLPPIELGQSGTQQGSDLGAGCDGVSGASTSNPYCNSPASGLGSAGNYYFIRTEGWGNPRSEGDAFTPSPNQSGSNCGTGGVACQASPPDVHSISPWAGSESSDPTLNYVGGSNFLIMVPPGQKTDLQIYNPSFAPDSNDQNGAYSYHEDDGSFADGSSTAVDYSAMKYTVFSVSTLSSRIGDSKVSQEVFYPYNATGLYGKTGASRSYFYFPHAGPGTATTVTNYTPATYHQWVSALTWNPGNANDQALTLLPRPTVIGTACVCLNNTTASNKYYRLEVDNVAWNGAITCNSNACSEPTTKSANDSKAHKGFSVRLAAAPPAAACSGCALSAMGDMTVYTPINAGGSSLQFLIPLFRLDAAYAGKQITVDVFDPGDVGGGPAYMALEAPVPTSIDASGYSWASTSASSPTVVLGTSIPTKGNTAVPALGSWPGVTGGTWPSPSACTACYQSAGAGGGSLYNGEWVQWTIQVPAAGSFNANGYWNLVYDVSAGTKAGDTFTVQVGYGGSPDHLLP